MLADKRCTFLYIYLETLWEKKANPCLGKTEMRDSFSGNLESTTKISTFYGAGTGYYEEGQVSSNILTEG